MRGDGAREAGPSGYGEGAVLGHSLTTYGWVWLIVASGALSGGLMVARRLIAGRLSLNVEFDLRQSLYTHLQRMSFGFYDKHQTGQLLSRATSDVSATIDAQRLA